jgi:hypothetical protein
LVKYNNDHICTNNIPEGQCNNELKFEWCSSEKHAPVTPTPTPTPTPVDETPAAMFKGYTSTVGGDIDNVLLPYFQTKGKACTWSRENPFWQAKDLATAMNKVNQNAKTKKMKTFWMGDNDDNTLTGWEKANEDMYTKVNIAAFLGQQRVETGVYNACDENNWSNLTRPGNFHSAPEVYYNVASACGQGGQQYNNLTCADGCSVDEAKSTTALTKASWDGAPPALSCKQSGPEENIGVWDSTVPGGGWIKPTDPKWNTVPEVKKYMTCPCYKTKDQQTECTGYQECTCPSKGDNCIPESRVCSCPKGYDPCYKDDATGKQTKVESCNPPTTTEKCCWWGRGAIQLSGPCNIGKLNKVYGEKDTNYYETPEKICASGDSAWAAGLVWWIENVQKETLPYGKKNATFNQRQAIVDCVNKATSKDASAVADACLSMFNTNSAIVNRGCLPTDPSTSADCKGHAKTMHGQQRFESSKLALRVLSGEDMTHLTNKSCDAAVTKYTS